MIKNWIIVLDEEDLEERLQGLDLGKTPSFFFTTNS